MSRGLQRSDADGGRQLSLTHPSSSALALTTDTDSNHRRPVQANDVHDGAFSDVAQQRRPRKRSRWEQKTESQTPTGGTMYNVSTLPTMLSSNLTDEQKEMCAITVLIEDTSKRLRTGDLGIPPNPEDRSPSPEPVYSHEGKRLNTREYRVKKRFETERHKAIQRMLLLNPNYRPPHDYRPMAVKLNGRVWIPQDENPEVNFVGLIIGPRGNTLKALEAETDTKIIIRGKGSVKEGKLAGRPLPAEDEPLHAYITANTQEAVDRGVKKIESILAEAVSMPEHQNELRQQQLKQLARLNGTLREDGTIGGGGIFGMQNMRCTNCGSTEHRPWNCPEAQNLTHKIRCSRCGGAGHIAKDCKVDAGEIDTNAAASAQSSTNAVLSGNANGISALDDLLAPAASGANDPEYMSLMAELGSAHTSAHDAGTSSDDVVAAVETVKPSTAAPPPPPSTQSSSMLPPSAPAPAPAPFIPRFSPGYFSTDKKPAFPHKFVSVYNKVDEADNVPTEYAPDKPPPVSTQPRMVVYPHNAANSSKPMPSAQAAAVISAHSSKSNYQFPRPPQQLLQVAQQRAEAAGKDSLEDMMAKIVTGANKITPGSAAAVPNSGYKSYQPRFAQASSNQTDDTYGMRSLTQSNSTASTRPPFGKPTNYNNGNPVTTSSSANYNFATSYNSSANQYYQQQQQQPQQQPTIQYQSSYWGSGGWNPNANPATAAPPIVVPAATSAYPDPYAGYYAAQLQQHQPTYYGAAQGGAVATAAAVQSSQPRQFLNFDASLFSAPPPPPPPPD